MKALRRYLCLGLALVASSSSLAVTGTKQYFQSELEAVQAATSLYNPISIREDREFMGTIYRSGNYFGYTVTAGEVGAHRIRISVPVERWDSVVALWHTHGDASPTRQYFSRLDTRLVKRHDKPLYLADFTGILKVFRPEDRTLSKRAAKRLGLPDRRGFGMGRAVRDATDLPVQVATGDRDDGFYASGEQGW